MSDHRECFDKALGSRLRLLREGCGLTCEEVARNLAEYGVTTSRLSVRNTELGQRSATAYELTVFPRIFGVALPELLDGLPSPEPAPVGPDEATVKAAQRLGWSPQEVDATAHRLWGRSLTAEREARIGGAPRTRADQARRGHVTRQLMGELRATG
ncbi:helix-turn-helix domain-containing protein [Streptomyces sp. NPDC004069]